MLLDKAIVNRPHIPEELTNEIHRAVDEYYIDNESFHKELEQKSGMRAYITFYCNNYLNKEFSYNMEETKITTMVDEHEFIIVKSFSKKSSLHIAAILTLFRLNSYFTLYLFDNNMIFYLPKREVTDPNQYLQQSAHLNINEHENSLKQTRESTIEITDDHNIDIKEYRKFSAINFDVKICSRITITNSKYSHSSPTSILNNLISKYFPLDKLNKRTENAGTSFIVNLSFKNYKVSGISASKKISFHIAALKLLNKIYPEITHYIEYIYLLSPKIRKQELSENQPTETNDIKNTSQIPEDKQHNTNPPSVINEPTLDPNTQKSFNKYRYLINNNINEPTLSKLQNIAKSNTITEDLNSLNIKEDNNKFSLDMLSIEEVKRIFLSTKNKEMKHLTENYLKNKLKNENNRNKSISEIINESISEEEYDYLSEEEDGADVKELADIFRPRV